MRLAYAAFGTETNTFSAVPTTLDDFDRDGSRMERHWEHALAPARDRGIECAGGFHAFAPPAGLAQAAAYRALRDELVASVSKHLPLDFVVLALHGAMVAQGENDCEGDVLRRVRQIVGDRCLIGAVFDPHAHLTAQMIGASDLLVAYKEYPHVDADARANELVCKLLAMHDTGTRPVPAVFDCRTISLYYTNREPMRSLVDRVVAMEQRSGVCSVSVVHGFPWGDVAEAGTKVLVYAGTAEQATRCVSDVGGELVSLRGTTFDAPAALGDAIRLALTNAGRCVLAEVADNPGGGAPADGTWLLRALIEARAADVAYGALCDAAAVAACMRAGTGKRVDLLVGGASSPLSGAPLRVRATVTALAHDVRTAVTGGLDADTGYGDVAVLRLDHNVDLAISTRRSQVFSRSFFERLGVVLDSKHIVALKSTNHFYHEFAPIAQRVLYVDTPGPLRLAFAKLPYRTVRRPIWPLDTEAPALLVR